jgi:hypothetical protein
MRSTVQVPINFAGAGDNTIVAASSVGDIHVYSIFFTVSGATTITFKAGTDVLTGALVFTGNGSSMTLPLDIKEPYFTARKTNAFIMNSTNAVQVSGMAVCAQGWNAR